MDNYTVYKHTGPTGKVYIGITARPVMRRWHGGSAYRGNAHFYAAIKKYGWDNIQHEIIAEGLSQAEACDMERRLIAKYGSTDPRKGYNRSPGGDKTTLGYKFSPESREKISRALLGKRKGIPHTATHREHIGQALKGRKLDEKVRAKLRDCLGDRFNTDTARQRQRENTPRGATHHRAQAVICLDDNKTFQTIQEAAAHIGGHRSGISACCRGKQKTAYGRRWAFVQEFKPEE